MVFEIAGTATMHNSFFLLLLLGFFPLSLDDYICMKTFFVCFSQNCKKGTLAMPHLAHAWGCKTLALSLM
jgi:hypothetical protein